MNETHDSAMFTNDENKFIRDEATGDILFLRTTPPPRKCLAAHLEAIGEPSQEYVTMTRLMKLIKTRKPKVVTE